jgi:hypothetical protein
MAPPAESINGQCRALNISDSQRCTSKPTANDNTFCSFHARQCYGLYMGYKRRNALLDAHSAESALPAFLRESLASGSAATLANVSFKSVKDPMVLDGIHRYLFKLLRLLEQVIRARKIHHEHFYSLEMDYGHQKYLDGLVSRRGSAMRALDVLGRRMTEVLYERETWFKWARAAQSEEEARQSAGQAKEKEATRKARAESEMFRRNWKEVQARLAKKRAKEEQKRQDAFLEKAWKDRMAERAQEDLARLAEEGDDEWDPIEDEVEEDKERFIDLIRHFLWMEMPSEEGQQEQPTVQKCSEPVSASKAPLDATRSNGHHATIEDDPSTANQLSAEQSSAKEPTTGPEQKTGVTKTSTKKKSKKKSDKPRNAAESQPAELKHHGRQAEVAADVPRSETREELRERVRKAVEDAMNIQSHFIKTGVTRISPEQVERIHRMPEAELAGLLDDITEIKLYMFCRQLLATGRLLPAALRATSVEAFLADPEITAADLRDLALRVEQPTLQAIRDACADFIRARDADNGQQDGESHVDGGTDESEEMSTADMMRRERRYGELQGGTMMQRYLTTPARRALAEKTGLVKVPKPPPRPQKMQVTLCGKTIWNYASESAMAREGWLHFSILANGCSLDAAIELCRNWAEFNQLNILSQWQFFPAAADWLRWQYEDRQFGFLELGFAPYYKQFAGQSMTTHFNESHGRLGRRRVHRVTEARNLICGYMHRNEPHVRRFIQYCIMRRGQILILVRDGKTGAILTAPDEEHRFLLRGKEGHGRASRNTDWDFSKDVGLEFFGIVEQARKWRLGFDDFYDVFIWDFAPGQNPMETLYPTILDCLRRARRIKHPREIYAPHRDILENIVKEEDSTRVRPRRRDEPSEKSVYHALTNENVSSKAVGFRLPRGTPREENDETFDRDLHVVSLEQEVSPETLAAMPLRARRHMMPYDDTDAAEDTVLFGPADGPEMMKRAPFREITNPIVVLDEGGLPPTIIDILANEHDDRMKEMLASMTDPEAAQEARVHGKKALIEGGKAPGSEEFIYATPAIWQFAYEAFCELLEGASVPDELEEKLDRLGFDDHDLVVRADQLLSVKQPRELIERDRSYRKQFDA